MNRARLGTAFAITALHDGRVAAGCGVGFAGDGPPGLPVARTDTTGAFAVEVPAGELTVRIDCSRRPTHEVEGVRVVAGRTTDVGVVTVERGRSITGSVTCDGAPVAGATVVVAREVEEAFYAAGHRDPLRDGVLGVHLTRSNGNGRFAVDGVGGGRWMAIADHADCRRAEAAVEDGAGDARVDLVMTPR